MHLRLLLTTQLRYFMGVFCTELLRYYLDDRDYLVENILAVHTGWVIVCQHVISYHTLSVLVQNHVHSVKFSNPVQFSILVYEWRLFVQFLCVTGFPSSAARWILIDSSYKHISVKSNEHLPNNLCLLYFIIKDFNSIFLSEILDDDNGNDKDDARV